MKAFRKTLFVSSLCIMALLIMIAAINIYMVAYSSRYILDGEDADNTADAVMVPGAYVFPTGQVSLMLADRLDKALELYGKISDKIIVSGDHGKKDYDEVRAMKDYLLTENIPEDDIFMDHAGFCTYDSMYRAGAVFNISSMYVCTQRYHLYRAVYIARKLGIEAYGVVSDMHYYPKMDYYRFREVFARVKDFFSVLFNVQPAYTGPVIDISGSGLQTEDR